MSFDAVTDRTFHEVAGGMVCDMLVHIISNFFQSDWLFFDYDDFRFVFAGTFGNLRMKAGAAVTITTEAVG